MPGSCQSSAHIIPYRCATFPRTCNNRELPLSNESDSFGAAALYKRPGFLLRRAHQIGVSLFLEEVDGTGITATQYGVLLLLRIFEGLDQIGLSRKVGLDRSTTALVVRKLEAGKYVVRTADPADRRRKIIVLTARGERLLEKLREPARRAQMSALSVFSQKEAHEFIRLLEKFVKGFNADTRAPLIEGISETSLSLGYEQTEKKSKKI